MSVCVLSVCISVVCAGQDGLNEKDYRTHHASTHWASGTWSTQIDAPVQDGEGGWDIVSVEEYLRIHSRVSSA